MKKSVETFGWYLMIFYFINIQKYRFRTNIQKFVMASTSPTAIPNRPRYWIEKLTLKGVDEKRVSKEDMV